MELDKAVEQALASSEPFAELRKTVEQALAQGQDRQTILADLETKRQQLRQERRNRDEDVLLDVMDCLVGWCGPHAEIGNPVKKAPQ